MTEFKKAMQDPAAHFSHPADIVEADGLSHEQRVQLLRQWENDAMQLEVATEENMAGDGERSRMREIHEALQKLGVPGESHPGGSKFG